MKQYQQFWIKERYNPQLGLYYVACGQMSKTAARRMEKAVYGTNIMYGFEDETAYNNRIALLRRLGEKVQ